MSHLHLTGPKGDPPTPAGQCEDHQETLSVFCLDDLEPLCQRCVAERHTKHRVYLLTEAAADCKEELRTSVNTLKEKMNHFEKVSQTCEDAQRHNQAEAERAEENIKEEFERLHQFLREQEAVRILALRHEREEKERRAAEQRHRINEEITSLEERIQLVEEELDAGGDGVAFLERCRGSNSAWTPHRMNRPLIDVAKHLGNLQFTVWEKMKCIVPYTPVTLDPRTAARSLKVSYSGLNSVKFTPELPQSVPANPERFHPYSSILAREGFDSGVHCWDVEVGETTNWTLGVAAESLSRRSEFEACPEAGLWCIGLRDGSYLALTTPAQTLNPHHLTRVRVRLDWDEGTLEFLNANTHKHLFTFSHRFAEKVFPYFESIASCGGFTVLEQSLKVSVGSDQEAVLAKSNGKMSETVCATGDKNLISCIREEEKDEPDGCSSEEQLIKTKPAVKTQSNRPTTTTSLSTINHFINNILMPE